jgi:hypothetical protein
MQSWTSVIFRAHLALKVLPIFPRLPLNKPHRMRPAHPLARHRQDRTLGYSLNSKFRRTRFMYGQLHAGDSGRPVQVRGRLLPLALELATRPEPIPDGDSGSGLSKLSRIDATEASWQSAGDRQGPESRCRRRTLLRTLPSGEGKRRADRSAARLST